MIYNHFHTLTTVEPLPFCTCANQNKDDKTKGQTPTIRTRLAIRTLYVKLDTLHTVCPQLYPLFHYTTNSLAYTLLIMNAMPKPTQHKPPPQQLSQRSKCNPPVFCFRHFAFFSDACLMYTENESCLLTYFVLIQTLSQLNKFFLTST